MQWYNSFVKYYSKRSGVTDGIATYDDLLKSTYVSNTLEQSLLLMLTKQHKQTYSIKNNLLGNTKITLHMLKIILKIDRKIY